MGRSVRRDFLQAVKVEARPERKDLQGRRHLGAAVASMVELDDRGMSLPFKIQPCIRHNKFSPHCPFLIDEIKCAI